MKKTYLLFWVAMIFLATGCGVSTPPRNLVSSVQIAELADCPFPVSINGVKVLKPNETTRLAVDQVGIGWLYTWSSSVGNLSKTDSSATLFTAPETDGNVIISVRVIDEQSCLGEAKVTVEVASQPAPTATEGAEDLDIATAVSTATATPTMSPTATQTAAATSTVTPSAIPSATFTKTPASTPLPVHTPTPTVPAFQIWLMEPKNETCVGAENAVFEWLATRPLNSIEGVNGEYFALNIWAKDTPVYSVSWIKNPIYEIENISDPIAAYTQEINCNGEDGCFWNVDLIVSQVDRGSGWKPESFTTLYSSPARWFCTEVASPPIPPTNTPEPPPTSLPCPPFCG